MFALVSVGALLFAAAPAQAGSGRLAIGLSSASGYSPSEPTWTGPAASGVGCVGLTGWWITGGHDYAGPRGEVLRTADDRRWGARATLCPTASGGWLGAAGVSSGQQHGTGMYATPQITAGLAGFGKRGPDGAAYGSIAPYLQPQVAMGVSLPPGVSLEFGPFLMIAPSVVRAIHGDRPEGMFYGQIGFELTILAGTAAPEFPALNGPLGPERLRR